MADENNEIKSLGIDSAVGEYRGITRSANPGLLDDPMGFTDDAITGLAKHTAPKVVYDFTSFGYNYIPGVKSLTDFNNQSGLSLSEITDPGKSYWDALEMTGTEVNSNVEKGFGDLGAMLSTTSVAATRLAQLPRFQALLQSSSKWDKLRGLLYTGMFADVASDIVHTRASDPSLLSLIPQEYRMDVMDWWIDRSGDSEIEGRFKNALEGSLVGFAFDVGLETLKPLLRSTKEASQASTVSKDTIAEDLEAMDLVLGTGNGDVAKEWLKSRSAVGATMSDKIDEISDTVRLNGIPEEDYWKLKNKLKLRAKQTRRGLDNRKRKGRLAKKKAKRLADDSWVDENLDRYYKPTTVQPVITDDVVSKYRDTPAPTAAAYRNDVGVYTDKQIDNNLPLEDAFKSQLDVEGAIQTEDMIRFVSGSMKEAEETMQAVIRNPLAKPEEKEFAKAFLEDFQDDSLTRLNPKTSGDGGIKENLRLAQMLNLKSKLDPAKVDPQKRVEILKEAYNDIKTKGRIEIRQTAREMGIDPVSLEKAMTTMAASGHDWRKAMMVGRNERHRLAQKVKITANKLKGMKRSIVGTKELTELFSDLMRLDTLDNSLQGTISSVARILGDQNFNPNDMQRVVTQVFDDLRVKEGIATKNVKPDVKPDADDDMWNVLAKMVNDKDEAGLQKLVKDLSNKPIDKAKDLQKVIKGPTFFEYYKSYILGNMLSRVGTITSSVLGASAVQATFKTVGQSFFETLSSAFIRNAGTPLQTPILTLQSLLKHTSRGIGNLLSGGAKKPLDEVFNIGWMSRREGTEIADESFADIGRSFKQMAADLDRSGAYTKARMVDISRLVLQPSLGVSNVFMRGIRNVDNFIKGVTSETVMDMQARKIWYREGGTKTFGNIDREEFVNLFKDSQRRIIEIDQTAIDATERSARVEKVIAEAGEYKDVLLRELEDAIGVAELAAKQATLQEEVSETVLDGLLRHLDSKYSDTTAGRVALLHLFPFRKTPINMLNEVIEHTPVVNVATSRRIRDAMLNGTPDEKLRAWAKTFMGFSVLSTVGVWAASGRIQGSIAPHEREKFETQNIPEHSVLIGDRWYRFDKWGPFAALVSAAADFTNRKHNDPTTSTALLFAQSLSIAADQAHMSTFKELLEVVSGDKPVESATKLAINRTTGTIIPVSGLTASLEDLIDPQKHRSIVDTEAASFWEQTQQGMRKAIRNRSVLRIPTEAAGLGEYDSEVDLLGNDVYKYDNSMTGRILHLLGIGNQGVKKEPYVQLLSDSGLIPTNSHTSSNNTVPLTSSQYKDMMVETMHGGTKPFKDQLNNLVTSDDFLSKQKGERDMIVRQMYQAHLKNTKEKIFTLSPELQTEKYARDLLKIKIDGTTQTPSYGSNDFWMESRVTNDILDPKNKETLKQFKIQKKDKLDEFKKMKQREIDELQKIRKTP